MVSSVMLEMVCLICLYVFCCFCTTIKQYSALSGVSDLLFVVFLKKKLFILVFVTEMSFVFEVFVLD